MALIYRSILEIEDPDRGFVDRSRGHVESWLRWKLRDDTVEVPTNGELVLGDGGLEMQVRHGRSDACSVRRTSVFEAAREDGVRVKTTLTAISDADRSWAWTDLERWTHDHLATAWVPAPPGVVGTILRTEGASRGGLSFEPRPASTSGDEGALVAQLVLDPERAAPVVVVSYNEREDDGPRLGVDRGHELSKRLAGIAPVYVLGEGAVTAFSRAITEALGEGMDVHSGAVRAYLPGAGSPTDYPARHRYVPFHKLRRRVDLAAVILAPLLLRRAVEAPPPEIWRSAARALVMGHATDADYDELFALWEAETAEHADARVLLDAEREDNTDLQRRNDDLGRRVRYLESRLREAQPTAVLDEPIPDVFDPVLCGEVMEHAREVLDLVEIPDSADQTAHLDAQGDESWARRSWSAFQALQNYAEVKRANEFEGSFLMYCQGSAGTYVIPASWVVPTETAQTLSNDRFRELRTLAVDPEVDSSGRVLMQEHVRIERGGTPSPRIYYYDDTRGATGRIHVGWFGDHLDGRGKS